MLLNPKVSIILLNLNGFNDTQDCLMSLRKVRYSNFEVIVVDNGSTDDSFARVQSEFPEVIALRSEVNLGFAAGNNLGIRHALQNGADFVLLLNNDTVVDANFLSSLVAVGEADPHIGLLGPKIFYFSEPERIWYGGGEVKYGTGICRHLGLDKLDRDSRFSGETKTPFVTGCALMVKSVVLRRIGLLDEGLFLYWEDADFCLRATRAGYLSVLVPSARIWHKISRTCGRESPFTLYLYTRNHLTWVARHVPFPYKVSTLPLVLCRKLGKLALLTVRGHRSAAAVWAGIWDFLRGKYGPPRDEWMPRRESRLTTSDACVNPSDGQGLPRVLSSGS